MILQNLIRRFAPKRFFCEDALITTHNHSFIDDKRFKSAYDRALKSTDGFDYHNRWRIHVALWAARNCYRLGGDFVECGVNYGFTSSAIMHDLNWSRSRTFWLIDSFRGRDVAQLSPQELNSTIGRKYDGAVVDGFYNTSLQKCVQNFLEWPSARVVKGWIPECLNRITTDRISFMHLDLNNGAPEVAAFERFRNRFLRGAMVLLDDYAYTGHDGTYNAWQAAARKYAFHILSLPTGQGLIQL
jgi:hypothetical protein